MTDPAPSVLTALYTLTGLLIAVFLGLCIELWAGWRARRPHGYAYVGHRWDVMKLGKSIQWYACQRCPARRVVRAEAGR